jgi:hypothetical protein
VTFHEFRAWVRQTLTNGRGLEKAWRTILMADPCVYCGGPSENLDHIYAKSKRGPDDWENRAPSCRSCNEVKAAAGLVYFLHVRRRIMENAARGIVPSSTVSPRTGCPCLNRRKPSPGARDPMSKKSHDDFTRGRTLT